MKNYSQIFSYSAAVLLFGALLFMNTRNSIQLSQNAYADEPDEDGQGYDRIERFEYTYEALVPVGDGSCIKVTTTSTQVTCVGIGRIDCSDIETPEPIIEVGDVVSCD